MEKVERQHPVEQDPQIRRTNFDAVESNFTDEQAATEASRCLHCKNAKCVQGCPVNIHIPDFIAAVKEGNITDYASEVRGYYESGEQRRGDECNTGPA